MRRARASALVVVLLAGAGAAHADVPAAPPSSWLGRVLAVARLPATLARRDAARNALTPVGTQERPDPAPYRRVAELAAACVAAAPAAPVDREHVVRARGVSIAQLLQECETLRTNASREAERALALRQARAQEIRPLLSGDRLKVFDAEGEPACDRCDGEARAIARAREWIYVRGPSGPLATYDTFVFIFRGDRLVEKRQRRSHERP
jgi:hypothetical protein